MLKKNSWIVALFLALTLTALFTGCIDAVVEEQVAYTEVELGDFNIWGGQAYQRGWAVAGMKFLGVSDRAEVAADKGYKNEDFAKATRLKIEMSDSSHPSGNLDIIWGAADASGNTVGFDWKQTGGIPFTKKDNVITIDLTKMTEYRAYRTGDFPMRKLVLQAGGESGGLPFVKKAWLMIPLVEEELPPEWAPDNKGDYVVPPNVTANEFFLDLNNVTVHGTNNKTLTASIDKTTNKLTINVTGNVNAVFFPFTAAQRALVCAAGNPVVVEITGTAGGYVRWCLGINDANNWNATQWQNATNDAPAANTWVAADSKFGTAVNFAVRDDRWTSRSGIVLNNNQAVSTAYTWEIESIKVSYTPPTIFDSVIAVGTQLTAPVTEAQAKTTVEDTQWSGAVTWSPALREGKYFEPYKSYTATIVFSPKAGYTFGTNTVTISTAGIASWNPTTRTVVTTPFAATSAKTVSNTIISGIRPFTGNVPKTTYDDLQYSGKIEWSPAPTDGKFVQGTSYVATITLKVKEGYIWSTFANTFTVTGAASTTNPAGSVGGVGTPLVVTGNFDPTIEAGVAVTIVPTGGPNTMQVVPKSALIETDTTVDVTEEGGYTWTSKNWDSGFVVVPITLPTGKAISDYTSIKVTITGSGSGYSYKKAGVFVADTAADITVRETGLADGTPDWNSTDTGYGDGTQTKTFTIAGGHVIDTSTSNTPYICIFVRAGGGATYTFKDIQIIE